jgi:AraC family transcriptional regulator
MIRAEQLLVAAAQLPDEALDEPVPLSPPTEAFDEEASSIRSMLNRLVFTKEMWSSAISGRAFAGDDDRSIEGMRRRLDASGRDFVELVTDIDERDAWDTAFVDALCDPPESFTFGGAVSHVLSWDAYRRQVVAGVLKAQGVNVPSADPIVWERER